MSLYPQDCSAACSERAVVEIEYSSPPVDGVRERIKYGACEEHRQDLEEIAMRESWRQEVTIREI